jgi:hypothetical protein
MRTDLPQEPPFMSPGELAALLKVTTKTLADWRRVAGRGPRFLKVSDGGNSSIRYRRADVAAWVESRTNPEK